MKRSKVDLFRLLLVIAAICLSAACSAGSALVSDAPLRLLPPGDGAIDLYQKVELNINSAAAAENPFDPAQIDLLVHFRGPTGQEMIVPAFWYQDFDPKTLQPVGEAGWKVRFTPTEAGQWSAQATLAGSEPSAEITFDVTPSDAQGFVRIDPRYPRYFAYDNGTPYFPIGLNIGWSNGDVLADYTRWLDSLRANGGNVARVWMASWSFGIEWSDTRLGDYSKRMKQAWLLDQIFMMAEERDITIMLTLINHGAFSTSVNPEWDANPYNAALGGPLTSAYDFMTDPAAKQMFQRRLRYIAARWGYSTSLFAWEWWNEVNWTGIVDRDLGPWTTEMTAYLKQFDPYDHLVTTSYADGTRTGIWELDALDFAQQHDYSGMNPLQSFPLAYERISRSAGEKPIVFGELGFAAGDDSNTAALEGIHLHNGLWIAPFTGYASTAMHWWWDSFVDAQKQWGHFRGISEFLAGEDIATLTAGIASVTPESADVLALGDDTHRLVWVRNKAYDVTAAQDAYNAAILAAIRGKTKLTDWSYAPEAVEGLTLSLTGLADGPYKVYWFDPQSAQWLREETVSAEKGVITLAIPAFTADLAAKIVAQSVSP